MGNKWCHLTRVLCPVADDARVDHDLLRDHPVCRGHVRQLLYSSDDRYRRYGVAEAEYVVVLAGTTSGFDHDGWFLHRNGICSSRMDELSTAICANRSRKVYDLGSDTLDHQRVPRWLLIHHGCCELRCDSVEQACQGYEVV